MIENIRQIEEGARTAFIDSGFNSNVAYRPQFVFNNNKEGKKVLSTIEDELMVCDCFQISVAFITMGGIAPLLLTLKRLEKKNIPGQILTTNYLNFSEPAALEKLNGLSNITIKMYDVENANEGFHTKGYIFKKEEVYRIIIGSSNITSAALTSNREWNTKIVSTEQGEYALQILEELKKLWNSEYALMYDDFFEIYKERYQIIKRQREIARKEEISSLEKYKLTPNNMQVGFIANLRKILATGENRALLISATGTGKTYASAFAMRELGFKRVLFLVHRGQLAKQTKKSYERVFDESVSMGLVGAGYDEYDKDYIFATVQTLNHDIHLFQYKPDAFDCIILDEAHHSSADTYQKVMRYFKPRLWLGMTATPDKRDDNEDGRNIYKIFHYQIAYEIRLQQAMEENMLCPFHYFGISDISLLNDKQIKTKKLAEKEFNQLICDERVKHIIKQAEYYGYSGSRVKGLIFCSRIDESEELSKKINQEINPVTGKKYRTIALNGSASEDERTNAFERLAMDEEDATDAFQPIDYILSVEILNEGVDIIEVNQVIMLRPTESPIVFIQQLGRGLRKADGKEYIVILDFIGNYKNNFMIPIALSGDRSYNADQIRKYVICGNSIIPGASTVHFDEVSKEKIFASIDKIKGMRGIIRDSYTSLKNRLGRVPYLMDFYQNGEIDPLVIIREYKTYQAFLEAVEKEMYIGRINEKEMLTLEYLSKTILSGARPYELLILKEFLDIREISVKQLQTEILTKYGYEVSMTSINDAVAVLQGCFVSKEEEYQKYHQIDILQYDEGRFLRRISSYAERLMNQEFRRQVEDLVNVGLAKYAERYAGGADDENKFVLYEKYSRRDVSLLMHCGRDLSSTMYGMKKMGDDVFIFVTYHKDEVEDENNKNQKIYKEGKPDYADEFLDNVTFRWDSQMGKGKNSSYMQEVIGAKRKHLLVKKSDAESNFYYMGQFDIVEAQDAEKENNKHKMETICKVTARMHHAVRDDILRYLKSGLKEDMVR